MEDEAVMSIHTGCQQHNLETRGCLILDSFCSKLYGRVRHLNKAEYLRTWLGLRWLSIDSLRTRMVSQPLHIPQFLRSCL